MFKKMQSSCISPKNWKCEETGGFEEKHFLRYSKTFYQFAADGIRMNEQIKFPSHCLVSLI